MNCMLAHLDSVSRPSHSAGSLCGAVAFCFDRCCSLQVAQEAKFSAAQLNIFKLRTCVDVCWTLIVATEAVCRAAAVLQKRTGFDLCVDGQPYPGLSALHARHLFDFCVDVLLLVEKASSAAGAGL